MTTDPKSIVSCLETLNTLAPSLTGKNDVANEDGRTKFVETAEKLAIAARYPVENIFFAVTRIILPRIACSLDLLPSSRLPMAPPSVLANSRRQKC